MKFRLKDELVPSAPLYSKGIYKMLSVDKKHLQEVKFVDLISRPKLYKREIFILILYLRVYMFLLKDHFIFTYIEKKDYDALVNVLIDSLSNFLSLVEGCNLKDKLKLTNAISDETYLEITDFDSMCNKIFRASSEVTRVLMFNDKWFPSDVSKAVLEMESDIIHKGFIHHYVKYHRLLWRLRESLFYSYRRRYCIYIKFYRLLSGAGYNGYMKPKNKHYLPGFSNHVMDSFKLLDILNNETDINKVLLRTKTFLPNDTNILQYYHNLLEEYLSRKTDKDNTSNTKEE